MSPLPVFIAIALVQAGAIASQPVEDEEAARVELPRVVEAGPTSFEFRSGFWINLHHVLWAHAFARRDEAPSWLVVAPEGSRDAWEAAVETYASVFGGRDLLFDRDLRLIDMLLSEAGAELPGELDRWPAVRDALASAAPAYRAEAWPAHDAANRAALVQMLAPLEAEGAGVATELARVYEVPWPEGRTVVDLLAYANWAGAYTSTTREGGHVRLGPARDPDPLLALEMLWHEAGHLMVTPRSGVGARIAAAAEAMEVEPPRDLWHVVIFHATPDVLMRRGIAPTGYEGYAERFGLYERSASWSACREAIEAYWGAYVEGEADLDRTIHEMVADLTREE